MVMVMVRVRVRVRPLVRKRATPGGPQTVETVLAGLLSNLHIKTFRLIWPSR